MLFSLMTPGSVRFGISTYYWIFFFGAFGLGVAYAIYLIRWSRQSLISQFRTLASG
jgi:hypothetical protein